MKKSSFIVVLILALLVYSPVRAATGCNYPGSLDSFVDKIAGDFLTIANVNTISCAIEKLETGPLRPNDGSAAAPSYAFRTSATAGMFLSAANQIDFSTSSTARWRITSGGNLQAISNTQNLLVSGKLLMNTTVTTGTSIGDIMLQNAAMYRFLNNAGTTPSGGLRTNTNDDIILSVVNAAKLAAVEFNGNARIAFREDQSGGGILFVGESAVDQAAPAANNAVLYTRDNGGGKTQLCVIFSSGAAQCIATQP